MSLLSLSKSLSNLIPPSQHPSAQFLTFSPKFLKTVETIPTEPINITSIESLKKFAYICNYQFKKNNPSMLKFSEKLLEVHINQFKHEKKPLKESIVKLYIITLINHSTSYERSNIKKAMNYLIRALKHTENFKFKSNEGKVLKFIVKIKESELCIFSQKYDLGITCAQDALNSVLGKLRKPNKPEYIRTLAKIAINAFHKIAVCEQAKGLRSSADVALDSAERIREFYLPEQQNLDLLEKEINLKLSNFNRKGKITNSFVRKTKNKRLTGLRIPNETIIEHFQKSGFNTDRSRISEKSKPEKIPGRYYSTERLKVLDKLLSDKKDPILMNTDNYFYSHISRELQITKDITQSSEKIVNQINEHIKVLIEAKQNLKNKKKIYKPEIRNSNNIETKLEKIQEEFDNQMKLQEVRLKSKLKTRVYKNLLKNINVTTISAKRTPPPQILFFEQPLLRRRCTVVTPQGHREDKKSEVKIKENKADVFKKEIECQLEEIKKEIHGLVEEKVKESHFENPGKLAGSAVKPKKLKIQIKKIKRVTLNPYKSIFKTEVSFK